MPSGKLWQEYNVLYVPSSTDDFLVTQIFSEVGIKDYVSLYNQYLPVSLTAYSPEISMFNLNKENPSYSYYKDREAYFFDKSYAYRLYYIPKNQAYKISECQALFAQKNISSNSDQTSSYPFLLPIIYALAVIILLLFSRHRLIFTLSALPSLLFLIYNPFFPLAISSLLLLFCSFFCLKLWKRKEMIITLTHQYFLYPLIFLSLVTSFSIGVKLGFLSILLILSMISCFFIFSELEDFLRNKKVFVPVFIKPARLIPLKDKNTRFSILSISFTSILIILVFFLSATSSFTTKFSKVVFPANVHSASKKTLSSSLEKNSKDKTSITLNTLSPKSLPQLEDYYQWVWNVKTTPYRSLNKENERNDMVEFPIYNEENGFISESKKIMVYNQSFKDSVFEEIDSLPFNAIEKVMKSEGQDFIAAYKASQNVSTSLFSIILMIICIFLLLFIYIFIMIERPKKRIHA